MMEIVVIYTFSIGHQNHDQITTMKIIYSTPTSYTVLQCGTKYVSAGISV